MRLGNLPPTCIVHSEQRGHKGGSAGGCRLAVGIGGSASRREGAEERAAGGRTGAAAADRIGSPRRQVHHLIIL